MNNNLCGKLDSSLELPVRSDERFKVTLIPFFIVDFDLFYLLLMVKNSALVNFA